MDDAIARALATERVVDITTTGRRSGRPSRIEMWFHQVEGDVYITGRPLPRDWYANMLAEPRFTFHLKQSVVADLEAIAHPMPPGHPDRARVIGIVHDRVRSSVSLSEWLESSPLVRVEFV